MAEEVELGQNVERVRRAVLRRGGSVTVGDIMSETGLGNFEAKEALDKMIAIYEGVLRVSEGGDLLYVFKSGCIRRDYRSWWQRNKDTIVSIIKKVFKVIIFLVLVVYFIIYLVILLTFLFSSRNDDRSSNDDGILLWGVYVFWGSWGDDRTRVRHRGGKRAEEKQPIYTKVYNFVFGPEEPKEDPLEAKTKCAQLIRARRGVITLRDWVLVSGQEREKCESDLARYTAEFEGNVEITNSGSIVYTFENMMQSGNGKAADMPSLCWKNVVRRRPLSGNIHGGDAVVIGLNLFNMAFASFITFQYAAYIAGASGGEMSSWDAALHLVKQGDTSFIWLGLFPFIFSTLIFAGPLVRLPGHLKENSRRMRVVVRKALLLELFNASRKQGEHRLALSQCVDRAHELLEESGFNPNSVPSGYVREEFNKLCDEFNGEMLPDVDMAFIFPELEESHREAQELRNKLRYDMRVFEGAAFSTDSDEQSEIEERELRSEFDRFSAALSASTNQSPSSDADRSGAGRSTRGSYDGGYGMDGRFPDDRSSGSAGR